MSYVGKNPDGHSRYVGKNPDGHAPTPSQDLQQQPYICVVLHVLLDSSEEMFSAPRLHL